MAITDQSSFLAAVANSQKRPVFKASVANQAAGGMCSLWRATGGPTQGAIPGAWATCTKALTGSFAYSNAPSGVMYCTGLRAQMATAGTLLALHRVGHMGGLNGTLATAQTVNASIPAGQELAADGSNAAWWLEWYTDTGGSAVTATISYTNQNDVTGRTCTVALAATTRAGVMLRILPTTAGDTIKSIQTVTLSVTTGAAGSFGVTLTRELMAAPVAVTNQITIVDPIAGGLPIVPPDACIALAVLCSTTSTGVVQGAIGVGYA